MNLLCTKNVPPRSLTQPPIIFMPSARRSGLEGWPTGFESTAALTKHSSSFLEAPRLKTDLRSISCGPSKQGLNVPVGRESHTIASRAEMTSHRIDDADSARGSLQAEHGGRSVERLTIQWFEHAHFPSNHLQDPVGAERVRRVGLRLRSEGHSLYKSHIHRLING